MWECKITEIDFKSIEQRMGTLKIRQKKSLLETKYENVKIKY